MYVDFKDLPASSRVWVYQAERALTDQETILFKNKMRSFCEGWNTHGNMMPTSFELVDNQIIILAVDESRLSTSGCSIDSSVRTLRELEGELGLDLTNQGKVSYKKEDKIKVSPALGIKTKVLTGEISVDTKVINPMIKEKSELDQLWIPAKSTWVNKFFPN
ncbi:hypothetical protein [Algoriphagus machipongonensis]|uniref:ABC transporter ATPase n=1 Tax=Algoriphagus machipongonensis TaxID=388413 RepID=A3HXW2_9BACT|nr:hypothetical protein [Algoriphagus machipongonensis]EAZ81435.1 hypothetical protein ALPR1_20403 [Algoriphagus machipongonensis]